MKPNSLEASPQGGDVKKGIIEALHQAGVAPGDTVFVHSDATPVLHVTSFGWITNALKALKDCFLEVLGGQVTLLLPTFNYDFCKGTPFHAQKSPSQVGVFSNYCFKLPEFRRSAHPIYSFCATGKDADYYLNGLSDSSFGKDSVFHKLHVKNAKLVFFNVTFHYCTYIHYVEQDLGVDYRFLKTFRGEVVDRDKKEVKDVDFYARYLDRDIVLDQSRLANDLLSTGMMQRGFFKTDRGEYQILQVRSDDVFRVAQARLREQPYYLLKHAPRRQS